MKRTLLARRPLAALAGAVLLVAAGVATLAGQGDDGPTKVAVGTPSTSTTVFVGARAGGNEGDGASTSWAATTTAPTLIPSVTPIPVTSPASTTSTTTSPGAKPKPTTTTTTSNPTPPSQPESIRYPTGPADTVEFGHVYVAALADAAPHRIASHPEVLDRAAWSPDGRRVIFGIENEARDVFAVKPDGSDVRKLPPGGIETPSWSPLGHLAVVEYDGSGHNARINTVAGGVHVIPHQLVGPVSGQRWSPDGSKLALLAGGRVWTANPDGGGVVGLTPEGGTAWKWLEWSPDGTRIAFHESERLKVVRADGSGLIDLAPMNADPAFSWSPDGTELVLCAPFNSTPKLAMGIVPAAGGEVRPLDAQCAEVSWSPDGRHIAYLAHPPQDGVRALKLISPDGSDNRTFIRPPSGVPFGPGLRWSPGSTHLLLNTGNSPPGAEQPF